MVTTITFLCISGCLSQKIPIEETEHNTRSIQLRVYQYNNSYYALPAFNVTMTNITWNGKVYSIFTVLIFWFPTKVYILLISSHYIINDNRFQPFNHIWH